MTERYESSQSGEEFHFTALKTAFENKQGTGVPYPYRDCSKESD